MWLLIGRLDVWPPPLPSPPHTRRSQEAALYLYIFGLIRILRSNYGTKSSM